MNKKLTLPAEAVFLLAILLISFAVAMTVTAGFGVSMIVAPAYIFSQKVPLLTFGQSEYVLQALLFVVFCLLMKRVRAVFFMSFGTCVVYGAVLDMWQRIIPLFNPAVTPSESLSMPLRLALFVCGMVLTSFSVALFFHTYLYPQVYDFFVKGISRRFNLPLSKFKTCFDLSCLLIAAAMSLLFFGKFVGLGFGTLVMTAINGTIIGLFDKLFKKHLNSVPLFPKFAEKFDL